MCSEVDGIGACRSGPRTAYDGFKHSLYSCSSLINPLRSSHTSIFANSGREHSQEIICPQTNPEGTQVTKIHFEGFDSSTC